MVMSCFIVEAEAGSDTLAVAIAPTNCCVFEEWLFHLPNPYFLMEPVYCHHLNSCAPLQMAFLLFNHSFTPYLSFFFRSLSYSMFQQNSKRIWSRYKCCSFPTQSFFSFVFVQMFLSLQSVYLK